MQNLQPVNVPKQLPVEAWIFFTALVVRLIYFAWSQSSPFLYQWATDEAFYVDFARHILTGKYFPYANFMDPLLAYLLVVPLSFFDNEALLRLLFVVFDSLNALLVARICFVISLNRRVAWAGGLLYAFFNLTIIYSVFITKSTPLIFCLLVVTNALLIGFNNNKKSAFILAGLFSVLCFYLGASFIILSVIIAAILFFAKVDRALLGSYLAAYAVFFLGIACFFHVTVANKTVFPSNGGEIFYIANHAGNHLGTHQVPGFVKESTPVGIYQAFKNQSIVEQSQLENDQAVSRFWYKKAIDEMLGSPTLTLLREVNKTLLLIGADDISQNFYLPYIKQVTLKNIPLVSFALILAFGVSGFCFYMPRDARLWIVLAPVGVTVFTCLVFFVSSRMRVPMTPFLMIAAAMWWRNDASLFARYKSVILSLLILLISYSVTFMFPQKETDQDRYNLAVAMVNARMYRQADLLVTVLLEVENQPKYVFLKAVILTAQDKCEQALPLYEWVLVNPGFHERALFNKQLCVEHLQQANDR